MSHITLTLPYPPTTGNHSTKKGARGFYTVPEIKRYREVIAEYIRARGLNTQIEGPLHVVWDVAPKNRRAVDDDNLMKVVKDALTRANFWVDDSNKVIRSTHFRWHDPVECGFVVLSIRPFESIEENA